MKHFETYPFVVYKHKNNIEIERTEIPLLITNPIDNEAITVWALIDTGADACLFPRELSDRLKHNFDADGIKSAVTGGVGGKSDTFKHSFRIDLLNHTRERIIWTSKNLLIDCINRDLPILLGVQDFLKDFELNINYPAKTITLSWD